MIEADEPSTCLSGYALQCVLLGMIRGLGWRCKESIVVSLDPYVR